MTTLVTATKTTTTITTKLSIARSVASFAWLGFIDLQSTPTQLLAIKLIDRRRGLRVCRHLDEGKPSRAPGVAIFDYVC